MRSALRRSHHPPTWLRPALASFRELAGSCLPATRIWNVFAAPLASLLLPGSAPPLRKSSEQAVSTEYWLTLAS